MRGGKRFRHRSAPAHDRCRGWLTPMARAPDLRRAAVHLAQLLGPEDCLLVGGMAVGAYGYVRATKDVDFVVRVKLDEVRAQLERQGIRVTSTRGDPLEGDFPCIKGLLD